MPAFLAANRSAYDEYRAALDGIDGLSLLPIDNGNESNYQYVVVEIDPSFRASRDDIVAALHAERVLARKYFWPGCHRMKPYRDLYPHSGLMLPNTEKVAARVIVLPTGANLPDGAIETITSVLRCMGSG
jgi:dTDP-4-amino-4,6-dideoxygalactose transaminase